MPSLRSKSGILSVLVLASALCAAAISPRVPAASPTALSPASPARSSFPDPPPTAPFHSSPSAAAPSGEFHNLKVLPKNISSKMLQGIMIDEFEDALGVGCGFCHGEQPGSHRPDYASDAKPEKAIARAMMRMTINLNKKYFLVKKPAIGDPALVITCNTCHHGQPHPDGDAGL
jgi:hypothetical protein